MNGRRWKTKSGVVVVERGRYQTTDRRGKLAWKVHAYREGGGFHGKLWLKNLRPVGRATKKPRRVQGPTPRAVAWLLRVANEAFLPPHMPHAEIEAALKAVRGLAEDKP